MQIKKFTYFYPEKPQLISIDQPVFNQLSEDPYWIAEKKYNENRLQLHYLNGEFQFWNRHGEKFNYVPDPELLERLHSLNLPSGYCLFDGGLRHNKVSGIRHKIVFYDVFIWDGTLLLSKSFEYRRGLLIQFFSDNDNQKLCCPKQFKSLTKNGFHDIFLNVTQDPEIEGLVIKDTRGKLNLGRKTNMDSMWMYKVRKPSNSYRL